MDKLRVKVYKEVLKDVSARFENAEECINERIEYICTRDKISAAEVINFFVFSFCF